jgi:succinate dehydrogenase/fumarate reductase flavoprotein subunit
MRYEDLLIKSAPKWPYKVNYDKVTEVSCDVLVLGGGIAGCWAAIGAAREGAKVVLVDKGAVISSGCGGSGVDHWQNTPNPACKFSPEEFTAILLDLNNGDRNAITTYIKSRESYDVLLEAEKLGMKVRDSEDVFKGAPFRDEKTKLCFSYDYNAKYTIRVWGTAHKPLIHKECKRLGVTIFDRTFVTGLLNERGKQGAAVVGGTAFNTHTGEFYVFNAKATVLAMALPQRVHVFSCELAGMRTAEVEAPGNMTGDGHAMAFRAGALLVRTADLGSPSGGGLGYPQYGQGNSRNTWYAASVIDAKGREIPWIDVNGNVLKSVNERYYPAQGQKVILTGDRWMHGNRAYATPRPETNNPMYEKPFYTDLTSMPAHERRAIFGLMVGQEGKTLIPIYYTYTQAGFDPDKDMLQNYDYGASGPRVATWLVSRGGGLYADWDLKTSLDRLYSCGWQLFKGGCHANAATTGRYAGRHAAQFALGANLPAISTKQVELEKARVYAPLLQKNGMEWKELNAGVCHIMQSYCTPKKEPEVLKIGLRWLDELWESEAETAMARNPRELMRVHEVFNIITNGQMIMQSCLASVKEKHWETIKLDGGDAKLGELSYDFAGDLVANYKAHNEKWLK